MKKIFLLSTVALLTIALFMSLTGCTGEPVELDVSAAATLTDALKEVNDLYMQENPNVAITANFTSSGTIQTQIENGAPVDIFFSGASLQMDNLQNEQLILNDTRKNVLTNKIVLIVPIDSTLEITSFNDLLDSAVKKVAIGDPESVTSGMYAQQALDEFGITGQLQSKLVLCIDVRQVLTYVESGNVDAGFVYLTDAKISTKVKVVANAPDGINAQIVFPVAVVTASTKVEAANDYIDFLCGDEAKAIFEEYGFTVISQ